MREIKFRAWIKEDVFEYQNQAYMENDVMSLLNPFGEHEDGNIILMQYTGLKDKNGVEIYEGDVVNFQYGEPPSVEITSWGHDVVDGWDEEVVGAISYERGAFMLGNHLLWSMEAAGLDYSLEVIGNIYEKPELLDQ